MFICNKLRQKVMDNFYEDRSNVIETSQILHCVIIANNENMESMVRSYFEELDVFHYKQDMKAIEHRSKTYLELKREYV